MLESQRFMSNSRLAMQAKKMAVLFLTVTLVAGCATAPPYTSSPCIIVRNEGGKLVMVSDQDPLYQQFSQEVLSQQDIADLFALYEYLTAALLATNSLYPHPKATQSRPVIVLDSKPGLIHDLTARYGKKNMAVEVAIALDGSALEEMATSKHRLPHLVSSLLMELVGVHVPTASLGDLPLTQPTTESAALTTGFAAAMDAVYGTHHPEAVDWARNTSAHSQEALELWHRYTLIPNGNIPINENSLAKAPDTDPRRIPGAVGVFFYKLIQDASPYYPQRYMLWFANFDQQVVLGKILLAFYRMPSGRASVRAFVETYAETFPAEANWIRQLEIQTFDGQRSQP